MMVALLSNDVLVLDTAAATFCQNMDLNKERDCVPFLSCSSIALSCFLRIFAHFENSSCALMLAISLFKLTTSLRNRICSEKSFDGPRPVLQ
jgi:hypothetical protein